MIKKQLLNQIRRSFVKQYNQNFCGLACLSSIVRYHGGDIKQENLTNKSGTTYSGTTLLGLYTAAIDIGLEATGFEAEVSHLKELKDPVILHTVNFDGMEHFIVCYGWEGQKFIIGDPGWGITEYSEDELDSMWNSRTLLSIKPGPEFKRTKDIKQLKKEWLKDLIRNDIPVLVIAAFLGIIIAIANLATAVFTQKLIDQILPEKNREAFIAGLILFGLVLLVKCLLSYLRGIFLIRQSREMNNRLVSFFFSRIMRLPRSFFASHTTGDMVTRLHDTSRIQDTLIYFSGSLIIDILIMITSVVYIFIISFPTGVISLLCLPVCFLIAYRYNGKVVSSQARIMQSYAFTESRFIEVLERINIIKSANREPEFGRTVKTVYDYFQENIFRLGVLVTKIDLNAQLSNVFIISAVIGWTSYLVLSQSLLLGQMMAIITLTSGISGAAMKIALANIRYQEARVAFDRMFEFASVSQESGSNDGQFSGRQEMKYLINKLSVRNLGFRFPGGSPLLHDINFTIKRGVITVFFGEVGCGKSTLLSILLRFYPVDSGMINLDDRDWNQTGIRAWRNLVSVVFQDEQLFNGTLIENICLDTDQAIQEECIEFCRKYGFDEFIKSCQQGYRTIIKEGSSNISGGQKQLIALARALFRKPAILLLDEVTASMDRKTEQFVTDLLQRIKSDMIIAAVSHRIQLAIRCDFVYLIENKTISKAGKPAQMLQYDNLLSRSYQDLIIR